MILEEKFLNQTFSELLKWEKRKRRERVLLSLACGSLLAALLALPLNWAVQPWVNPWLLPGLFWLLAVLLVLPFDRSRAARAVRAIVAVDMAIGLKERAITAWEILRLKKSGAPELLVLKEAAERLRALNPRRVFPRKLGWEFYSLGPLFALWLGLMWLGVDFQPNDAARPIIGPSSMAHRVREFSRELQARAKAEGLNETLSIGRELERAAQKRLAGQTGDERFQSEVGALAEQLGAKARAGAAENRSLGRASDDGLRELKTELQSVRDLKLKDGFPGEVGSDVFERLAGLPHLKGAIENHWSSGAGRGRDELQALLEKLERDVSREMDRRALLETRQFLNDMLQQGNAQSGQMEARVPGQEEAQFPAGGEQQLTESNLPGTEPGSKKGPSEAPLQSQFGAATHLKGLLRDGSSTGIVLKGKPAEGKARVSEDDVVTAYRRRAEAELNTERVPEELKAVIKNYFLSLGMEDLK